MNLKSGRIAAMRPTDEVLEAKILQRLFGVQAKVYYEPHTLSKQAVFKTVEKTSAPPV